MASQEPGGKENVSEAVTELSPGDDVECEDWLQLPLSDVDAMPQTVETGVNPLQEHLLEDVDVEEQLLIQDTLLEDIRVQVAQLLQLEQYCSTLMTEIKSRANILHEDDEAVPHSGSRRSGEENDDLYNLGLNTKLVEVIDPTCRVTPEVFHESDVEQIFSVPEQQHVEQYSLHSNSLQDRQPYLHLQGSTDSPGNIEAIMSLIRTMTGTPIVSVKPVAPESTSTGPLSAPVPPYVPRTLRSQPVSQQMLGSLVVDTVYPAAGLYRLENRGVRRTESTLRGLREGLRFREVSGVGEIMYAGSRPEGLCVAEDCGHGRADVDMMYLCGGDLGVYVVPSGQQPPGDATLVYTPQQCPHAYTRLQVLHKDRLLRSIMVRSYRDDLSASAPEVQQCVFSEGGRMWLHSRHTLEVMQLSDFTRTISGPAGQSVNGLMEQIYSLVCSGPHPAMASYKERPRKHWPSPALLDALIKQPMLLVMLGPKYAQDSYLMFRVSWSGLEIILISSLGLWVKQGYVSFKYTVKSVLRSLRPKDSPREGRSQVGSYHLKTVFLRHLEEHPPQQEGSPFQLMLDLCQDLQHYLLVGCLPHYFLPECDLLRTVGDEERHYALQAVGHVIAHPIVAILNSPSEPRDIYGPHHSPDDLIRCFGDLCSLPSCPERRECLLRLLRHLDDHRESIYRNLLERDGFVKVSGRPGLIRLVDYLQ